MAGQARQERTAEFFDTRSEGYDADSNSVYVARG